MLWYAVAWSCCNEFCFVCELSFSLAAEQNQFFINLIKTWECFTDHHPRIVSRVTIITCVMLEVSFTPKHQTPYGTVLASAASKMLLWDLVAGHNARSPHLFVGFFFSRKEFRHICIILRWCTDVEAGMASGDQCHRGGEGAPALPPLALSGGRSSSARQAGAAQALERRLLGQTPVTSYFPLTCWETKDW